MNKQKYVDAELEVVTFAVFDVIATSAGAEIPSTTENNATMPSMGPNDTEIL